MSNSIEWSLDAIADLQEIYDYVAEDRVSAADKLIDKLLKRPNILKAFPAAGRHVPEFPEDYYREVFEAQYRIIYSLAELPIIRIVRVIHFARRLPLL